MEIGTVQGAVWATRKTPELGGYSLLVVKTDFGRYVASDLVGAGVGDGVLIVTGSTARMACREAQVDAAIVAILDGGELPNERT